MTKTLFVLSTKDMLAIRDAGRPRLLSLEDTRDPQEMANLAWAKVGRQMGFDWMSVEPTDVNGEILAYPLKIKGANDGE